MIPTTNFSLKKIDGSENWREIFDDHNDSMDLIDAAVKSNSDEISTTEKSLIYVVDGNKCANAVPVDSYVQLINSTISGRSDGCYTVKTAIPANTAIDNTYFNETAPIAGGAINSLNSNLNHRIQQGTAAYTGLGKNGWENRKTVTVTLPHQMPNANYFAHAEMYGAYADYPKIVFNVFSKTVSTFDVELIDMATGDGTVDGVFKWIAIATI